MSEETRYEEFREHGVPYIITIDGTRILIPYGYKVRLKPDRLEILKNNGAIRIDDWDVVGVIAGVFTLVSPDRYDVVVEEPPRRKWYGQMLMKEVEEA
ncbi:MAG: hypothetical protein RXR82_06275 [Nitrososphaeria archaeon]